MSILHVLLVLAVIGVITWLIVTYVPMPEAIKKVIIAVAIIVVILWLLQATGVLQIAEDVTVPQVK